MAQRSEEERVECAAAQEGDLQETNAAAVEETLKTAAAAVFGSVFPSQRMHSKGEQGNQMRSLPVSM